MAGKSQIKVEMLWAVSLASFLMAQVDGELSDEEYDTLGQSLADMVEGRVTGEQLDELLGTHADLIEQAGFDGAAEELAKRLPTPESRRAALLYAASVAYADNEVAEAEEEAFSALAEALGFSDDEAREILESALSSSEEGEEEAE